MLKERSKRVSTSLFNRIERMLKQVLKLFVQALGSEYVYFYKTIFKDESLWDEIWNNGLKVILRTSD